MASENEMVAEIVKEMKASEMTNCQIADAIESAFCASSSEFGATMREAAARLRKTVELTPEMATEMCRCESALRDKLRVAEDALVSYRDFMRTIENDKSIAIENRQENCFWASRLDSVIAAIREEGGVK